MPLIGEGPAGGCGPHFNHKGRPWACCHHGSAPQVTLPRRRCLLLSGEMSLLFFIFFFWGGLCLGRVVGTWCFAGRAGVEFGRGEVEASGEGPVLRHYCSK